MTLPLLFVYLSLLCAFSIEIIDHLCTLRYITGPFPRTDMYRYDPQDAPNMIVFSIFLLSSLLLHDVTFSVISKKLCILSVMHTPINDSLPDTSVMSIHFTATPLMLCQQTFWHVYGSMITTALVVYFSLPAAVTAGAFRREVAGGQLDSLSTLPG